MKSQTLLQATILSHHNKHRWLYFEVKMFYYLPEFTLNISFSINITFYEHFHVCNTYWTYVDNILLRRRREIGDMGRHVRPGLKLRKSLVKSNRFNHKIQIINIQNNVLQAELRMVLKGFVMLFVWTHQILKIFSESNVICKYIWKKGRCHSTLPYTPVCFLLVWKRFFS